MLIDVIQVWVAAIGILLQELQRQQNNNNLENKNDRIR